MLDGIGKLSLCRTVASIVKRQFRLVNDTVRQNAVQAVRDAQEGYAVTIAEETRSDAQNRHLWPLISDIQAQNAFMATFSADDVKLRFMNALGKEMRFLPELEGGGMFPVGQRSSLLTKKQFAGLLEIIFHWGAKNGIQWSRKSQDVFENRV